MEELQKTSGAGGGDSGIAFVFEDKSALEIIKNWKNIGITNLPLTVYDKEKKLMEDIDAQTNKSQK